jgi:hypothetical protein
MSEQIVYVVTRGDYSDYGIQGVFTDKSLAEAMVNHINLMKKYEDARIEEYPINPHEAMLRAGVFGYQVMMTDDGTVKQILVDDGYMKPGREPIYRNQYSGMLCACVTARDEWHAIKITNDRRAAFLALETNPPPASPSGSRPACGQTSPAAPGSADPPAPAPSPP